MILERRVTSENNKTQLLSQKPNEDPGKTSPRVGSRSGSDIKVQKADEMTPGEAGEKPA